MFSYQISAQEGVLCHELLLFGLLDAFVPKPFSNFSVSHSPKFLVQLMNLYILPGKCLPRVLDLSLFLRDKDENEACGTLRSKIIPTVH